MPLSLVELRGILKDQPGGFQNGLIPEAYLRQNFRFEHGGDEDLAQFVNAALQEVVKLNGMVVHKKEPHMRFDLNNQTFVPMHMFSRIDIWVKPILETPILEDAVEDKPEAIQ